VAYVITRLCIDCKDRGCVEACPVECIYEPRGSAPQPFADQLYIHPTECINCGACAPECPWEAIFEDAEVPALLSEDTARNAAVEELKDHFRVAPRLGDPGGPTARPRRPDAAAVAANRRRHGL
jgi:ferredoxin